MAVAILLTVSSQYLLKTSIEHIIFSDNLQTFIKSLFNKRTFSSLFLVCIVPFFVILAMTDLPLNLVFALSSLNQVLIQLVSYFLLNEKISQYRILGVATVFSGIIIFILGFIGAYIERILLEVKNRPSFIVKETFGIDV